MGDSSILRSRGYTTDRYT